MPPPHTPRPARHTEGAESNFDEHNERTVEKNEPHNYKYNFILIYIYKNTNENV